MFNANVIPLKLIDVFKWKHIDFETRPTQEFVSKWNLLLIIWPLAWPRWAASPLKLWKTAAPTRIFLKGRNNRSDRWSDERLRNF